MGCCDETTARVPDPSVSRLHAEIVRRGPYAYVADLGLSRNGTRVNGRLVARRVLERGRPLADLAQPALVNGGAGLVVGRPGQPIAVVSFTIAHGRIAAIDLITDREKLARVVPR